MVIADIFLTYLEYFYTVVSDGLHLVYNVPLYGYYFPQGYSKKS